MPGINPGIHIMWDLKVRFNIGKQAGDIVVKNLLA